MATQPPEIDSLHQRGVISDHDFGRHQYKMVHPTWFRIKNHIEKFKSRNLQRRRHHAEQFSRLIRHWVATFSSSSVELILPRVVHFIISPLIAIYHFILLLCYSVLSLPIAAVSGLANRHWVQFLQSVDLPSKKN